MDMKTFLRVLNVTFLIAKKKKKKKEREYIVHYGGMVKHMTHNIHRYNEIYRKVKKNGVDHYALIWMITIY